MKAPRTCAHGLLRSTRRKILDPPGARGVPICLFSSRILFLYELKLCAKFHNPRTTHSGRKVCGGEEKKENITKYSGHFARTKNIHYIYLSKDEKIKKPSGYFFLNTLYTKNSLTLLLWQNKLVKPSGPPRKKKKNNKFSFSFSSRTF
jgi:hypothetical protein